MKDRDIIILRKIIQYADEIGGTIKRFDLDFDKFKNDYVVKNAISMCVLQIGELAGNLTEELKEKYDVMPWRTIISIRNRAAHAYGTVDWDIFWNIAINNIPELKTYCACIINEMSGK